MPDAQGHIGTTASSLLLLGFESCASQVMNAQHFALANMSHCLMLKSLVQEASAIESLQQDILLESKVNVVS